jgi:predicted XRE-type DNA-binding protein
LPTPRYRSAVDPFKERPQFLNPAEMALIREVLSWLYQNRLSKAKISLAVKIDKKEVTRLLMGGRTNAKVALRIWNTAYREGIPNEYCRKISWLIKKLDS